MTKLRCDICGEKRDQALLICECQTCNNKEHKKSWKMGYDVCLEKVEELIEKDNIDLGKIDGMTISEILKLYKSKIKQNLCYGVG